MHKYIPTPRKITYRYVLADETRQRPGTNEHCGMNQDAVSELEKYQYVSPCDRMVGKRQGPFPSSHVSLSVLSATNFSNLLPSSAFSFRRQRYNGLDGRLSVVMSRDLHPLPYPKAWLTPPHVHFRLSAKIKDSLSLNGSSPLLAQV
jgi:hypothetical protein